MANITNTVARGANKKIISIKVDATQLNTKVKRKIADMRNALADNEVSEDIARQLVTDFEPFIPYSAPTTAETTLTKLRQRKRIGAKTRERITALEAVQHKHMSSTAVVHGSSITYTGINERNGYNYTQYAYKGISYNGKPLNYYKGVHQMATARWDKVAFAQNGDVINTHIAKIVRRAIRIATNSKH